MQKRKAIVWWLICGAVLSGCATPAPKVPVAADGPRPAPPSAAVMAPREANFQERLLNFFSALPEKPTK